MPTIVQNPLVALPREFLDECDEILFEANSARTVAWANRAARRFFGEQIISAPVSDLFANNEELRSLWRGFQAAASLSTEEESGWHRRADQVERLLNWRFYRTADGDGSGERLWLCAIDITGGDLAPSDPGEARATDPAPLLWELDLQRGPPRIYRQMVRAFGLAASGRFRPDHWADHIHPRDLAVFTRFRETLIESRGGLVSCIFRARGPDSDYRWFKVSGQVTSRSRRGAARRAIGTVTDITLGKWAEEEQSVREARALQYQKMEAIGELAGGIAHDFNNTLTTIMGYTELALLEVDQLRQHKLATYMREVYDGGRRARQLIAKMLQFSRQEEAHPARVEVTEMVGNVVNILRATLPASIRISVDCDKKLPAVWVDESLLNLVMINICINASDAMHGVGVIYVRARMREAVDALCASCHDRFRGNLVELAIEDSGPGIPPEMERRIFEPYMSTKQTGSGMGLAVAHGILHQQGGHLLVDTILGDGTEFRLYVPPSPRIARGEEPGEVLPIAELESDPANRALHILVVDDEAGLRSFLCELLERHGYQVSTVPDGMRAWEICRAAPDRFDLIVTDQAVPGLSGVELAARIRALRPELPVILCTGYSEVVNEGTAAQFGVRGYIAKPIDTRKLLDIVDETLHPAG